MMTAPDGNGKGNEGPKQSSRHTPCAVAASTSVAATAHGVCLLLWAGSPDHVNQSLDLVGPEFTDERADRLEVLDPQPGGRGLRRAAPPAAAVAGGPGLPLTHRLVVGDDVRRDL